MKVERTGTTDAARTRRGNRDGQTPAPNANAPHTPPVTPCATRRRYGILCTFSGMGVAPRPEIKDTNHKSICPAGIRSAFSCAGATLISAGRLSKHEVAPMSKKNETKNGRKATSTTATSAAKKNHTAATRRTASKKPSAVYKWDASGKPNAATRKAIVATFAALRDAIADHATEKASVAAYKRGLTANKTLDALIRAANLDAETAKASFATIEARLMGKTPEAENAPTGQDVATAVDKAAERAAKVYGDDDALAEMFAAATVEESDEPTQPGVFVMATAPDYTHAGMFATALAAQIFDAGQVITDAIPYGEMEADNGEKGYVVSWFIENPRKA